ncbi:hypothetical protein GTP45_10845 [Pseudoduganella sp. FT55W]|uniref:SPOR domain-containing protein n=1 Tax=Duganella rivi TaxID=2666083 RepID=A0A7X4KCG6_9BURK|nr:SPOR domain-containing protein [Duganella rivi]MYM67328.1 hypothetical protein [Duganella rivi]
MEAETKKSLQVWLAIVPVIATLVSTLLVAWVGYTTSKEVALLERDAHKETVQLEQVKFREQQEARRLQFLEKQIPLLLSEKEIERKSAAAIVRLIYPSEAADIFSQVLPVATEATRPALQRDLQDAETLRAATADWAIVISGDKTLELAKKWTSNLANKGYSPVRIFLRDGFYRVTAGSYPSRLLAEQAAIALRPITRQDAYVIGVGTWCPGGRAQSAEGLELTACQSK